ncbi:MAG: hypothetical protein IAG13_37850 [Deltaproteobacteria bacterium]|nr:hypothetical protein [Nannocystaceae bacterium]
MDPVDPATGPAEPVQPLSIAHEYVLTDKSNNTYSYTISSAPLAVNLIAEHPGKPGKCKNEDRCHFWRDEDPDKWHLLLLEMKLDRDDTVRPTLVVKWAESTAPYLVFDPPVVRLDDNAAKTTTFTFEKPPGDTPVKYVLVEPSPAYRLTVKVQLKP